MATSVHIDGSLQDFGPAVSTGIVFSGRWAVTYDWAADSVINVGQPKTLSNLPFPPGFDSDLDGALRGREVFSDFLYIFKNGQYIRLRQAGMTLDVPAKATAPAWDLPADWTALDAVLPGSGIKSGFAYFFRGDEYCRYDWKTDKRSPGYPKKIAPEWKLNAPFVAGFNGVVIGQAGFSTKAYLFKTLSAMVSDASGNLVPPGSPHSHNVLTPGYSRYDFDLERTESAVIDPAAVVDNWNGLLPMLDLGPALDTGTAWCNAAIAALVAKNVSLATPGLPSDPNTDAAFGRHFKASNPSAADVATAMNQFIKIRDRLARADRFEFKASIGVAETIPGTITRVGPNFSKTQGPNGRAATMIHEAVHFIFVPGGLVVDVPEWSGESVNGTTFGIDTTSNRAYSSLSSTEALANPSSYAAFAQEVFFRADRRFGGARPHE